MNSCPKCGQAELTSVNQYGFLVCEGCGFVQIQKSVVTPFWILLKNFSKSLLFGGVLVFFAIMSIQVFVWERFGFDATMAQVKIALGVGTLNEEIKLGSICNSLGDHECSIKRFSKVVEEDPNHEVGLSNLAIALSRGGKYKEAKPYFDAYFSLGGNAFDALYWYGVALEEAMSIEKAFPWYYYALSINNQFFTAGEKLVKALQKLGRHLEAESLVGSLTKGQLRKYPKFKRLMREQTLSLERGEEVYLPSVDGRFHYIPIRVKDGGRKYFAAVSSKSDYLLIDEDILFENQISIPEDVKEIRMSTEFGVKKVKKIKLEKLEMGPWSFKDLEVLICSGCQSVIGKPLLKGLTLRSEIKYQTHFLVLAE